MHPHTATTAATLALCAGLAAAQVSAITGVTLQGNPALTDLTAAEIDALNGDFGVISAPFSAAPDITSSTAILESFTTASGGIVTGLLGPSRVLNLTTSPTGSPALAPSPIQPAGFAVGGPGRTTGAFGGPSNGATPTADPIRNVYGFLGTEPDGAAAILGAPNLGAGLDNAGAGGVAFDVLFDTRIIGAAGAANDFFLFDIIGDDAVLLQPLNAAGEVIGDFSLTIQSGPGANNFGNSDLGDFGLVGLDLALILDNSEAPPISQPTGTVIDDVPIAGVAFDIESFVSDSDPAALLDALYGLRITALDPDSSISSGEGSIDLLAIGFSAAAVPTPAAGVLLGLAGSVATRRRRPR